MTPVMEAAGSSPHRSPPHCWGFYTHSARYQAYHYFLHRPDSRRVYHHVCGHHRNFSKMVLKSDVPVLVGLRASWCALPPVAPVMDPRSPPNTAVKVAKVDVDAGRARRTLASPPDHRPSSGGEQLKPSSAPLRRRWSSRRSSFSRSSRRSETRNRRSHAGPFSLDKGASRA